MPRPKRQDRPVDRHVAIPESVDERLNEYLRDPVTGKPKPGARSRLVEKLIRKHLEEEGY